MKAFDGTGKRGGGGVVFFSLFSVMLFLFILFLVVGVLIWTGLGRGEMRVGGWRERRKKKKEKKMWG